jgi:hypothetical protein
LGKGKRLIVLHAGTRSEGLIDGCDLVFLAKSKDGDYHQEMNSVVFLEWLENQVMPALKNPILVVLDNASYHNVKTEDTVCPNFSQKKVVLQNYLTQHDIPFSYNDTKKVLYEKIKQKKTPVVNKTSPGDSHHPLIWPETLNRNRQSNPHFAYQHAKQSNVCLYPRVFVGHQTHNSEATYNLRSDFG